MSRVRLQLGNLSVNIKSSAGSAESFVLALCLRDWLQVSWLGGCNLVHFVRLSASTQKINDTTPQTL